MLLKTLQLTVRNLRGISRVITTETFPSIQAHSYGKWTPRQYAAIVNEDELFDIEENTTPPDQTARKPRSRSRRSRVDETEIEDSKSAEVTFDDEIEDYESVKVSKAANAAKATKAYRASKELKDSKSVFTKLHENEKIVS